MDHLSQSQLAHRNVTEWLLHQQAQRAAEPFTPSAGGVRTVVTLSRQYGAGGHAVGRRVAELLGPSWQFWDRELLDAIARSAQVRTEMVEALDERTQGWVTTVLQALFRPVGMEPGAYHHHLATVLLAVAHQGRKVLLGRGANFLLPEALNVRLRASLDQRVQRIQQALGLSQEDARAQVQRADRDRAEFIHAAYSRDPDDPSAYAMVLQTDALGEEATAAAIVAAMRPRLAPPG